MTTIELHLIECMSFTKYVYWLFLFLDLAWIWRKKWNTGKSRLLLLLFWLAHPSSAKTAYDFYRHFRLVQRNRTKIESSRSHLRRLCARWLYTKKGQYNCKRHVCMYVKGRPCGIVYGKGQPTGPRGEVPKWTCFPNPASKIGSWHTSDRILSPVDGFLGQRQFVQGSTNYKLSINIEWPTRRNIWVLWGVSEEAHDVSVMIIKGNLLSVQLLWSLFVKLKMIGAIRRSF